jgi:hypothetical protein
VGFALLAWWTWVFSLSLSLSFFGPSFPPLLGALFNGVCQVFITFNGFFLPFFGLSIKGTTLWSIQGFCGQDIQNFCGPGLGFRV